MKHTHRFARGRSLPRPSALAGALALMMPALAAHAQAVLRPDAGAAAQPGITTVGGTPVVDITAPNAAGLSHNRFSDYNVGADGLILNNSATSVHTQLAGTIAGNAQLGGAPARVILNEVTGGRASQLNGATEIAGQAARLIVANPNGIVANGAGFINATRATLVAGKPVFDQDGGIASFETRGRITVDGKGLDAGNTDVDLVARSLRVNAELRAKKFVGVALDGNVKIDGDTVAYRRNPSGADTPDIAIDVARLGSMHANAITLVGGAKGVGVNVDGKVDVVAGDPRVDANGRIVTQTQRDGVTVARSPYGHVNNGDVGGVGSGSSIVSGQSGANVGWSSTGVAQNGGLAVTGGLANQGRMSADTIAATGGVSVGAGASLDARQALSITGGLSRNDGRIHGQSISITGGAQVGTLGQLSADGMLQATGRFDNRGAVRADRAQFTGGLEVAQSGSATIAGAASVNGGLTNRGTFRSGALNVTGGVFNAGKLRSEGSVTIVGGLDNAASGRLSAAGSLLTVGGQSNSGRIEQYARIDTLTAAEPVAPPIEANPAESAAVPPVVDKPAQPDSSTQVADARPTAPVAPPAVEQPARPVPPTQVANTTPAAPVVRPVAPPSPVSWIVHRIRFWLASFFQWA
ncbi:filamentous hemagglutinin N-terminal domain-containing protein [Burkholderia ubonensis]|uniref:filamentous hemagglutinin N-terminal domain-containing protein n=1 Tax=Burkholderia ubonensis TaxID=101571 RepID=UPI0009B4B260|nr:filamentous hemagglutinin N-terminal domain-containing protein [Burkholderia ubonensis]